MKAGTAFIVAAMATTAWGQPVQMEMDPGSATVEENPLPETVEELSRQLDQTPHNAGKSGDITQCLWADCGAAATQEQRLKERAQKQEAEREQAYKDIWSDSSIASGGTTEPLNGGDIVTCDEIGCTNSFGWRSGWDRFMPITGTLKRIGIDNRAVRDWFEDLLNEPSVETKCERQGYKPGSQGFINCVDRLGAPLSP